MMKRALIFIESASNEIGRQFVHAARRLGLLPVVISSDPVRYDFIASDEIDAVEVDTGDLDAVIDACGRLKSTHNVAGIMSNTEGFYAMAGVVCRHFGLPGPNPAAVTRCQDKFTQRRLLKEAGVSIPVHRLATNVADAADYAAEIGLPVVLKPVSGRGSGGIKLCHDVDEVVEHTAFLLAGKQRHPSPPKVLVEELVAGPLCGVHLLDGKVVGIASETLGELPYFELRGFTFPAQLAKDDYNRVADIAARSLQALALNWGPAHAEIKLTNFGPVVIEVNPRLSGPPDPEMIRLAHGIDLITETIKLFIGQTPELRKIRSHAAASQFLIPDRDGVLEWIKGERRARAIADIADVQLYVNAKPGRRIVRRRDFSDVIGHVIAASPSPDRTDAALRRALHTIEWSVAPFPRSDEREQQLYAGSIDIEHRVASKSSK